MSNESRTLLVTVGSTLFSSLTDRVLSTSVLDVLASQGITTLIVQYGAATLPNVTGSARLVLDAAGAGETTWTTNDGRDMHIEVMRYSERYTQLVASADAVISHAGAGSILTVLRMPGPQPKPLLVVPNSSLMDNHQAELADAMEQGGYLTTSTVENLETVIPRWLSNGPMVRFPEVDTSLFRDIVDRTAGFAT